jgi:Bacterial protein of unknown function (DUF937)
MAGLVSEIADVLGPPIVSRIASSLGLGQSSTQRAVNAAVPGLLGALISLVSKPQGATKLNDVLAKQPPGLLSSLANVIGESGEKAFIDRGASALDSLLGGTTVSALTSALGRYAGIGGGGSKSLLGLLGPAILGLLGQEQRDRGLDASGLAKLLTSQKDNVIDALPSGFSRYLEEAGVPLADVTPSTARSASREQYGSSTSVWPWLLGALAALAIGGLLWNNWAGSHRQVAEAPAPKIETPSSETNPNTEAPYANPLSKLRGIKVGDVDIGELATSAVNDLNASLSAVTDEATAKTELPGITKASSELDQLTGLLNQLSPENQKLVANTLASIRPNLDQLMDKALALPGVGAVIKPVVDALRSKLDTFATA